MRVRMAAALLLPLGLALAACGDSEDGASSGTVVEVTATDDSCELNTTELEPGTVTFQVANEGEQVTEFYVYTADGDIVSEVEDISPGLSRDLEVDLEAGDYQGACKPGMTGDGIRTDFTVSGS